MQWSRRQFLGVVLGAAAAALQRWSTGMRFGLVTYLWGRDWGLPELIANCTYAGALGVELRTEHAHGVEPSLSTAERKEVRRQFEGSQVEMVGLGTNWAFHYPDGDRLEREIAGAKAAIVLSHDVGGSGVKVKPDALPDGVPHKQTIEQIGTSLNGLARFGADYGQEIRLEVHGRGTEALRIIRSIMEIADHPGCRVCWNSNAQDMAEGGLKHNFELVQPWLGQTVHVREFDMRDYDYRQLMELLVAANYSGWVLMEARTEPKDRVAALKSQRRLFDDLIRQTAQ